MRARIGTAAALGSLLTIAATAGCEDRNLGEDPDERTFFFPSGLLLDPVDRSTGTSVSYGLVDLPSDAPPDPTQVVLPDDSSEAPLPGPRYLYVANGNNDRTYNAGTLLAIDLQDFWAAWYSPYGEDAGRPQACAAALEPARAALAQAQSDGSFSGAEWPTVRTALQACDPRRGGLDPYCHSIPGVGERCVLPAGSPVVAPQGEGDRGRPCRRLPLLSRVAECDEQPFVRSVVRVGDFATTLASSIEGDTVRLWLPVRGDPSVTYVDAEPRGDGIALECDQDEANRCGDTHLLDQLRNDDSLTPLDREPFNMAVWERPMESDDAAGSGQRLAFVAHADGSQMSMIDLDGVRGGDKPALVDFNDLYITSGGVAGGFGLAIRPCFAIGEGPLGMADPEPNVPAITQGCTRPLVYSSFRYAGQLASFTASGLDVGAEFEAEFPAEDRTGCTVTQGGREVYAGPYCATPEQQGFPCALQCEPQVRGARRILPSLLLDTSLSSAPILGDMAFADPRGDQLLILQTNPGALLSLDTSLLDDGEPQDIPSAPPLEICAEPSRMKIYTERTPDGTPVQRYALITCFRAALVYVVDLEGLAVVEAAVVGTGPHDIAIDDDREAAYIINNLESSVSVIDLSRRRGTRFQELARLGLQDPFSQ